MRRGTSSSTPACSACGWSRRPSTRTTRPSTTSSTPTRAGIPAPTSPSSSTPGPGRDEPALEWSTRFAGGAGPTRPRIFCSGGPANTPPPPPAGGSLTFVDPKGLRHELAVVETGDDPLTAEHPEFPAELALQGFDGLRAFTADPERSR